MKDLDYQYPAGAYRVIEKAKVKPRWFRKLDEMINYVKGNQGAWSHNFF